MDIFAIFAMDQQAEGLVRCTLHIGQCVPQRHNLTGGRAGCGGKFDGVPVIGPGVLLRI